MNEIKKKLRIISWCKEILHQSKTKGVLFKKQNEMFTISSFTNLIFALIISVIAVSCSDDDNGVAEVDGLTPVINLESSNIRTEQGRKFYIVGTITDKDGLRDINLKNIELFLDKTIDLSKDSTIYEYKLNYMFETKKDLIGEVFPLVVTVTDLGGRSTIETINVTMDGDFVAPVFKVSPSTEVTVLLKDEPKLNVKFVVDDDKALDVVNINIVELNYTQSITTFTNDGKTLNFSDEISLPAQLASYNLNIVAQDKGGLTSEVNSKITVSEMPDFEKMYLSDVELAEQLNSDIFGIPMLIDHSGEYEYTANYYSEDAGAKIKFIPQKSDFSPICFGIDPSNTETLSDNPDLSEDIVLPSKGYFKIVFNVKTGTYSVNQYVPTDTPVAIGSSMYLDATRPSEGAIPLEIGLVGSGIPGVGSWNTAEPLILTQDSENKYLFSVEMTLEAGTKIEFIIQTKHSWGWWPEPFWRWDSQSDPEKNVSNGGENPAGWTVTTSGKYMFKFDSHLKRSKLYPIN